MTPSTPGLGRFHGSRRGAGPERTAPKCVTGRRLTLGGTGRDRSGQEPPDQDAGEGRRSRTILPSLPLAVSTRSLTVVAGNSSGVACTSPGPCPGTRSFPEQRATAPATISSSLGADGGEHPTAHRNARSSARRADRARESVSQGRDGRRLPSRWNRSTVARWRGTSAGWVGNPGFGCSIRPSRRRRAALWRVSLSDKLHTAI